jgi:hypothetical protein
MRLRVHNPRHTQPATIGCQLHHVLVCARCPWIVYGRHHVQTRAMRGRGARGGPGRRVAARPHRLARRGCRHVRRAGDYGAAPVTIPEPGCDEVVLTAPDGGRLCHSRVCADAGRLSEVIVTFGVLNDPFASCHSRGALWRVISSPSARSPIRQGLLRRRHVATELYVQDANRKSSSEKRIDAGHVGGTISSASLTPLQITRPCRSPWAPSATSSIPENGLEIRRESWHKPVPMCGACWDSSRQVAVKYRPGLVVIDATGDGPAPAAGHSAGGRA